MIFPEEIPESFWHLDRGASLIYSVDAGFSTVVYLLVIMVEALRA